MKLRLIAVVVTALVLTAGTAVAQDTSSEKGKLSYALGYDLGRNASESGEQLDVNT
ncbi:MAG TPA: FKBP-type peptidyl-prolyl cis-trans isomerase, partial [Lysobacter sp.]